MDGFGFWAQGAMIFPDQRKMMMVLRARGVTMCPDHHKKKKAEDASNLIGRLYLLPCFSRT
jgi:hypothetical protein